jgi:hypothetical protein
MILPTSPPTTRCSHFSYIVFKVLFASERYVSGGDVLSLSDTALQRRYWDRDSRPLIQDKTQEVRKLADQAWQKGLEQAKPYLDYSPKVQELVMQNKETLMQGNLTELWEKVRIAAKSGNTGRSREVY